MVNDICGFADPRMPDVCRDHDAAVVKMASPPDLERPGAIEKPDDIYDALKREGLTEKTIVDPAFGGWSEAKTIEDDRETFHRLREFRGLGCPILVSINRKNFLREFADRSTEEALPVSLAATSMAVERGAHIVRTHDVAETADAAKIGAAFARDRVQSDAIEGDQIEGGQIEGNENEGNENEGKNIEGDETDGNKIEGDENHGIAIEELDVTNASETARHLDRLGADPERADEMTTRVFELSGLTDAERETLQAIVAETRAVVAFGTTGILLGGSPAALARLRSCVGETSATPERLGAMLDAVKPPER
jgi:dihydropteroate synthase